MTRYICFWMMFLAATGASGLNVEQFIWGFDGRAVPGRFCLFSVLVSNPESVPVDSSLILYGVDGLGGRRGGRLVEPCFLAPFASKWVQFHVYINESDTNWVLTTKRGPRMRLEVDGPNIGPPATVYLRPADDPFALAPRLHAFPDNLFPPTVAATDGLHAAVLTHVPRWEEARRSAFADWVRGGGVVHLVARGDDVFPSFRNELEILNVPLERSRVGAGWVIRHRGPPQSITPDLLRLRGFPAPELKTGNEGILHKFEDVLFPALAMLVQPEHSWFLIYLIAVIYILVVCLANWYVGHSARHYWQPLAFFVGAVCVAALALNFIGRRGYGETTSVHTLSYARHIGGASYDVTQWTNAFVTKGAHYAISHPSPHNLYATCQAVESVNAVIQNGKDGSMFADIPIYSKRAFMHRGRMAGSDLGLRVKTWKKDKKLTELNVETGAGFPAKPLGIWALCGKSFREMTVANGQLRLTGSARASSGFLATRELEGVLHYSYRYRHRKIGAKALFREFLKPLIARSIGGTNAFRHYVKRTVPADDCVELFIFAPSPDSFALRAKGLGRETGYTLYHTFLFKPEEG